MNLMTDKRLLDTLHYRGPEMDADGLRISKFVVEGFEVDGNTSFSMMQNALDGRACEDGTYYRLVIDNELWMSDTTAEREDHVLPVAYARVRPGGRGLVNGLGLGMVVGAMLEFFDHVDVVEKDERVVEHIGGWFKKEYGDRVSVHLGDALTIKWPANTYWDVVWHDIWPTICDDNLPEMHKLHRRYGRRCFWQGSWARHLCERGPSWW